MQTTIPRKNHDDIPTTMFLRVKDPTKESGFDQLLHDLTPLFVYANDGADWVRWDMPREVAQACGWGDMRCDCCAPDEPSTPAAETVDSFHIDTAWSEVGGWLTEHGYRRAVV